MLTSLARAAGLALALAAGAAAAQDYPARPLHIIVNGAPGSLPDLFARPIAEKLRQSLGQAVIVDNKPGAGGMVAMTTLKNAAPDGYTLALVTNAHAVWNQYLFSKLPYDPKRDLQPISPIATIPMVLTAGPSAPGTLAEFVAQAKARPGVLNYASSSNGSPPHVLFEMFKGQAGIDVVHVPFKSGPDAVNATLSDRTQVYLVGSALAENLVKAGRLKALAVGMSERLPSMPDVPTFAEQGYPGHEGVVWLGLVGRAGTPAAIVDKLNVEVRKILLDPDIQKTFAANGSLRYSGSAADFARRIEADHALWGPVIRKAGIKLD